MIAKQLMVIMLLVGMVMIPGAVFAGKGVKLTIDNRTGGNITIIPRYANCYYANDLEQVTVQGPGEKVYYTEEKAGGSCFGAKDKDIKFTIKTQDGREFPVKLYLKVYEDWRKNNRIDQSDAAARFEVSNSFLKVVMETSLYYEGGGCFGGNQCKAKLFVE